MPISYDHSYIDYSLKPKPRENLKEKEKSVDWVNLLLFLLLFIVILMFVFMD